jgi:hypothetical protein
MFAVKMGTWFQADMQDDKAVGGLWILSLIEGLKENQSHC